MFNVYVPIYFPTQERVVKDDPRSETYKHVYMLKIGEAKSMEDAKARYHAVRPILEEKQG